MENIMKNKSFDDLVFENRNQEYGAYELRKRYARNVLVAFLVTMLLLVIVLTGPGLFEKILEQRTVAVEQTVEVSLENPPPLEENEENIPPPEAPPVPLQDMVKFTVPEVTNEAMDESEIPPTQDEMKVTNPGSKTQEGTEGYVDVTPVDTATRKVVEEPEPTKPFLVVEQMPEFPGGIDALRLYVAKHLNYPQTAFDNEIKGRVTLRFVINADGRIGDVDVLRGVDKSLDMEAIRVIKSLPSWKAGKQNGKAVPVYFTFPIVFSLNK